MISVPSVPTTPSVTVTVLVLPAVPTTFTVDTPLAVVMAAVGMYRAVSAELFVVIATAAVCPSRSPAGMLSSVIVVAKVTTELLAVAVGAIAVTVAVAFRPVMAGKVIVAFWPTLTEVMSASAMFAVTVMAETSAIVTKPEEAAEAPVPEAPLVELPEDTEPVPPAVLLPTTPFAPMMRPAIGAFRVAAARSA